MVWLTCVLTLVAGTGLCTPKLTDLEEQVEVRSQELKVSGLRVLARKPPAA